MPTKEILERELATDELELRLGLLDAEIRVLEASVAKRSERLGALRGQLDALRDEQARLLRLAGRHDSSPPGEAVDDEDGRKNNFENLKLLIKRKAYPGGMKALCRELPNQHTRKKGITTQAFYRSVEKNGGAMLPEHEETAARLLGVPLHELRR